MIEYKAWRIINGKPRWIITDERANIINRYPDKEDLKDLAIEIKPYGQKYTDKELLNYLIQFDEKYGRIPAMSDFNNNPRYPNFCTYSRRFGSWSNALKLAGMDLDTRVLQGNLETNDQKARYAEIKVINHFRQYAIDLSKENHSSPCDGICPNGMNYDVKSSKLDKRKRHTFHTDNKYKEEIEMYYLLGFNEDYTKLEYAWRVPGEIIEKDYFQIGPNRNYEFNIENMKEYDITDKFKDIINT